VYFLVIAIIVDAVAIFFIRRQVFEWGLVLTAAVALYLLFHRSLRFLKELFVASLYTAGILLLSVTVSPVQLSTPHYLIIIQFAIAAWTNLLLFSWFDQAFDQRNEQNSFVTILGRETAQTFLYGLFAASYLLTILQFLMEIQIVFVLILFLMNAILFLIFIFRNDLERDDRYRLIGDAVFLLPLIVLVA
jgi:4-hydroxybenzoate polyprenyltransferase